MVGAVSIVVITATLAGFATGCSNNNEVSPTTSIAEPTEVTPSSSLEVESEVLENESEIESEAETEISSDNYSELLYGYYYDFENDGFPEVDGHVVQVGDSAVDECTFVVTDDNKVYVNEYSSSFNYFCTVDSNFKELVPVLDLHDDEGNNHLIVRNNDNSYTYYNGGLEEPINFEAEGLVLAEYEENVLYVYTLDNGNLYITELNSDGSVNVEKTPVVIKEGDDNNKNYVPLENVKKMFYLEHSMYILDSNGEIYKIFRPLTALLFDPESPNGLHSKSDSLEMPDGTDEIIADTLKEKFVFTISEDKNNLYLRNGLYKDISEPASCITLPLPDGCTIDDIESAYYDFLNVVYIVTKDKKVYGCYNANEEDSEKTWELDEKSGQLYSQGNILSFHRMNNNMYALCDDGRLYELRS